MSDYTVTFHWGETWRVYCGMPEEPLIVDGETMPWQAADVGCCVETAVEWCLERLGPDFYGDDDDALGTALDCMSIDEEGET